jgi:hypothetical protein
MLMVYFLAKTYKIAKNEETRLPIEDLQPAVSHRHKLYHILTHNVVSNTPCHERIRTQTLMVIGTDCIGSCNSTYQTIMITYAQYNII